MLLSSNALTGELPLPGFEFESTFYTRVSYRVLVDTFDPFFTLAARGHCAGVGYNFDKDCDDVAPESYMEGWVRCSAVREGSCQSHRSKPF